MPKGIGYGKRVAKRSKGAGNAAPKKRGSMTKKMAAQKVGSAGTKVARTPVTRKARPMTSR
jgi:hypothetical protein